MKLFIVSNQGQLNLLELVSYLSDRRIAYRLEASSDWGLIFETNLDPKILAKDLGSLIKIGSVKLSLPKNQLNEFYNKVKGISFYDHLEDKVYWAISLYEAEELKPMLEAYFLEKFKEEGIRKQKILKVYREEPSEVFSSELERKKVIERGFEIVGLLADNKYYLGRTLALIDNKGYYERDFKRPYRESKISIPPKLARTLSNLAGANKGKVILDPFCGTGTILQEAMLLGSDVIGVDINEFYVKKAKENLSWLKSRYKLSSRFRILRDDSRKLSHFLKLEVDGIATEPILLPTLKKPLSKDKALNLLKRAERIYQDALKEFVKIMKDKAKLALVQPYLLLKGGELISFPLEDYAKSLGLKPYNEVKVKYPLFFKSEKEKRVNRGVWLFTKSDTQSKNKLA
ncbi:MAG: DNA methyltransferase [Nitrososphaerales archaeon]